MSGLAGFKERMKAIQDSIKAENEKADQCTKSREELHKAYCRQMGKQHQLRDKIQSKEDEMERITKKLKEIEERLQNKEQFLTEAAKFNRELKQTTPKEGEGSEIEQRLRTHKKIYHQNNERYMQAKEHKINLEEKFEHIEERGKVVYRKVEDLQRELESCLQEEGRRAEQCKQTMDAAFKNERNVIGVTKMLEELTLKTKESTKKVGEMTKRKIKLEEGIEETNYERRVVEATIKEILTKEGAEL